MAANQDPDSVLQAEEAEPFAPSTAIAYYQNNLGAEESKAYFNKTSSSTADQLQSSKFHYFRQLNIAAYNGNWEAAKGFFDYNLNALTEEIAILGMNALHVASLHGQTEFVVKLMQLMNKDQVLRCRAGGYTALHHAVYGGHLEMAKALIQKNSELTKIENTERETPLFIAGVCRSDYEMVRYLIEETQLKEAEPFARSKEGSLMVNLTHMGFHDLTLQLIQRQPSLALAWSEDDATILQVLAYEPEHFRSGAKLKFWQNWIYHYIPVDQDLLPKTKSGINEAKFQVHKGIKELFWSTIENFVPSIRKIGKMKLNHERACKLVDVCLEALLKHNAQNPDEYFDNQKILHFAARHGVIEVVTRSLDHFPDLFLSEHGLQLLKNAIQWRQENIFTFACQNTAIGKLLTILPFDPSISHVAAKLPENPQLSDDSSAVLQMQSEVHWYKEIGRIEHPRMRQLQSKEGETAFTAFSNNHRNMRERAETWMKDTSNSTMVVSTLIATVAFAAAFTLPGGTNEMGAPIFLQDTWFLVFVCSDTLALFSSITSVLMFLSILTSRYKEDDFRTELPRRMILGLAALFLSLATIMVAFGAALHIVLRDRFSWVCGPILFMAVFPITLFIWLQLPLFLKLVLSTYGPVFKQY